MAGGSFADTTDGGVGDPRRSRNGEEEALLRLENCERRLNAQRHHRREKLGALWGPEPPYRLQPEDAATSVIGRLYYTWVGGLMFRAAREELGERDMPRPTRAIRAHNSGMNLSRVLQEQKYSRHAWDAYVGMEVRHRRDRASVGELRWVGYAQQMRTPRQLYAGVEWRVSPEHHMRKSCMDASHSPFTDGVVDGERLFQTTSGDATATCERVEDIVIVSSMLMSKTPYDSGMPETTQQRPRPMSVARALFTAFYCSICELIPFRLVRDASQLAVPVVLELYIEYIQAAHPSWRDGLLLVVGFALLTLVQSASGNKLTQLGWRCGYTFQNALQGVLFEKCATISRKALTQPEMSVGRIVNMLSSDMNSAKNFPMLLHVAFGAPLQLAVALALLYRLVGWCAFAGFGVLVVFMPLQGILMQRYYGVYARLLKATDARLKATNEFFSGMRVVKFMSWEPSFIRDIEEKRRVEIAAVRSSQLLYVVIAFLTNAIPAFVIAVVFLLYHLNGNDLTPAVVFPTIALLGIMQTPFIMIPVALSSVARFIASMRRITKFLECEDVDDGIQAVIDGHEGERDQEQESAETMRWMAGDVAAEFTNATIATHTPRKLPPCAKERRAAEKRRKRNKEQKEEGSNEYFEMERKDLLRDITLRVPKGKLTCVIGETGSGKSTLLDSLLKSHEVVSGTVRVVPNIAYVPQQAWIMNATLKENVLFFSDMDEDRFRRVLRCTQLEEDLKLLPDGVETEIGEKGINLSGGQKARVNLARAVYAAGRELYLLDDPLSALDAHVGERVMRECILGELKGTTRLLVTHQLHVLRHADQIVVLREGGTVAFTGNYEAYVCFSTNRDMKASGFALISSSPAERAGESRVYNAAGVLRASEGEAMERTCDDQDHAAGNNDNNNNNDDAGSGDECAKEKGNDKTAVTAKLITDEEKATGAVSWSTYMQYAEACGGHVVCGLVLLLFFLTEFVVVSPSLWLSFWSVKKFDLSPNTYLLVYIGVVAASALSSPLRNLSAYAVLRAGSWNLHRRLLRSLAVAPVAFFDTTPLGRVLNRFSKDMGSIDGDLQGSMIFFVQSVLSVISSVVVLTVSQYFVLIVIVPCAVLYYRLMLFYNSANREIRRVANRANSPVFSILGEMLSGRWTVAAYGRASDFMRKALGRIDTVYACSYMKTVCDCWLAVRLELLSNVVLTSVALVGVLLVMLNFSTSDVGLLSLSLTMAININSLLKYLVNQAAAVEADMNCVERVLHYTSNIEHEDLLDDIDEAIRQSKEQESTKPRKKKTEARGNHVDGREPLTVAVPVLDSGNDDATFSPIVFSSAVDDDTTAVRGAMEFRDVTMRYRPGLPLVLRGVSFIISPGQKVAVVGRTGSGKSSLLLTFLRIVENDGGEILISGRPIRSYKLRELRQLFSMIPQDPLLFHGTVRANLDLLGARTDAEVHEAIRLVGLQERFAAEADVLRSRVEEGGANFSVGQRQLLCMARALLRRDSCFVLMDEATANVDPELDAQIQRTITRVFAGQTVITIAHRLQTVARYDTVLVMEAGRVVEAGPPGALARRGESKFARMLTALGETAVKSFLASAR